MEIFEGVDSRKMRISWEMDSPVRECRQPLYASDTVKGNAETNERTKKIDEADTWRCYEGRRGEKGKERDMESGCTE